MPMEPVTVPTIVSTWSWVMVYGGSTSIASSAGPDPELTPRPPLGWSQTGSQRPRSTHVRPRTLDDRYRPVFGVF